MITRRTLARSGAFGPCRRDRRAPYRARGGATLAHGHLVAETPARAGHVG